MSLQLDIRIFNPLKLAFFLMPQRSILKLKLPMIILFSILLSTEFSTLIIKKKSLLDYLPDVFCFDEFKSYLHRLALKLFRKELFSFFISLPSSHQTFLSFNDFQVPLLVTNLRSLNRCLVRGLLKLERSGSHSDQRFPHFQNDRPKSLDLHYVWL